MATVSRPRPSRKSAGYNQGPWFNKAKGAWYLTYRDEAGKQKQKRLSADETEARQIWHSLQAGTLTLETKAPSSAQEATGQYGEAMLVGELVNLFLEWQEPRISASRFHGTKYYLKDFARHFGANTIAEMRLGGPAKVERWMRAHTGWEGCRLSVVSRVKQLFLWGSSGARNSQGFYSTSPIGSLERPKDNKRVHYFTPEQVEVILANSPRQFALAFRCLLATGCRPAELAKLTADDVCVEGGEVCWLIDHKNIKHTGKKRRVYLTEEVQQITRSLLKARPKGRLFQSDRKGHEGYKDLSEEYLNHCLRKVTRKEACKKFGLDEHTTGKRTDGAIKRGYKYVAYCARHTFAVRYLTGYYRGEDGTPIILGYPEVACYLGNSAGMVEKIYGHLVDQTAFLSARLKGAKL